MVRGSAIAQKFFLTLFFALLVPSLPAQTFSVVHYFTNFADGFYPTGDLVVDGNTLYGTARQTVFRVNTDGTGYAVLKNFTNDSDGIGLVAGLVLNGSTLYGTASLGGTNGNGAVFKLETNGTGFAVLKNFAGSPDGRMPYAGLLLSNATLYGTTMSGGTNGDGTVYKLDTDGSDYSVLKSFTNGPDGSSPRCRLVSSGNTLYGEASYGGTNGVGTVFKLNNDGNGYAVLKSFAFAGIDGESPSGGLVLNGDTLYGTTSFGGSNNVGTVFKINTNGTGFGVLKHFANSPDQSRPSGGLLLIGDTLYGTTSTIGNPGNGMVFKVNTDGSEFATMHSFSDFVNAAYPTNSDGASPQSALVVSDNTLYGTASLGGVYYEDFGSGTSHSYRGLGTVFRLTLSVPLQIFAGDASFGVKSNIFGFTVTGNSNQTVVVEACANLTTIEWSPLQTNTFGAGAFYFSDPDWTNFPGRFYRARTQ
jgi:uncharacterized repeat protein (TIGR03803 family)